MHRTRDCSSRIWRTVVFAGAMLGAPACHHDTAKTTMPENTAKPTTGGDQTPTPTTQGTTTPPTTDPSTPGADPCSGAATKTDDPQPDTQSQDAPPPKKRPRGGGDRPTGRGFVLS